MSPCIDYFGTDIPVFDIELFLYLQTFQWLIGEHYLSQDWLVKMNDPDVI